jgi:hypothetical protein
MGKMQEQTWELCLKIILPSNKYTAFNVVMVSDPIFMTQRTLSS